MLKFKRLNMLKKARETNTSYYEHDLLRQTSLERLIKQHANLDKSVLINEILLIIKKQLREQITQ